MERIAFDRDDIVRAASEIGVKLPKNLGDVVYSFRYRQDLPELIQQNAPAGTSWVIRPAGPGQYSMEPITESLATIVPRPGYAETKVPDATPGIITMYAFSDEQALLAKLRYNRLVDIFTGVTCCSLQSHLRTAVDGLGQVETDELYIGIDKRGCHYVLPVQAKGGKDRLGIVQVEQDIALCKERFGSLTCYPIAAQFMQPDLIAMFRFEQHEHQVVIASESHYHLVPPDELSDEELRTYRDRPFE